MNNLIKRFVPGTMPRSNPSTRINRLDILSSHKYTYTTKSIRSSIVVPPIQPILDVINQSGASIYTQTQQLFVQLSSDIATKIENYVNSETGKIETVITNEKTDITTEISALFDASVTTITNQMNTSLHKKILMHLLKLNDRFQAKLIATQNRLAISDKNIQGIISTQNGVALNDITTGLTAGKNSIYDQI